MRCDRRRVSQGTGWYFDQSNRAVFPFFDLWQRLWLPPLSPGPAHPLTPLPRAAPLSLTFPPAQPALAGRATWTLAPSTRPDFPVNAVHWGPPYLDQSRLMKQYADQVIIAYDSDLSGPGRHQAGHQPLTRRGSVKVLKVTGAKDPDEFLKSTAPARFKVLLENSSAPCGVRAGAHPFKHDTDIRRGKGMPKDRVQLLPGSAKRTGTGGLRQAVPGIKCVQRR